MEDFQIKGSTHVPEVKLSYQGETVVLTIDFMPVTIFSDETLSALVDCIEAWTDLRERKIQINCSGLDTPDTQGIISKLAQQVKFKNHVHFTQTLHNP